MSHAFRGVVMVLMIFVGCTRSKEGAVLSERVDDGGLTLVIKVPPNAGVVCHPGNKPPVYADDEGKVEVVFPTTDVPMGTPRISVFVEPESGEGYSFEYLRGPAGAQQRLGNNSALPPPEGTQCAAFLQVDPKGQVLFQGCPEAKHTINGKPVRQGPEQLTFGDVLGDMPLNKLVPAGRGGELPTPDVQTTVVRTGVTTHHRWPVEADWRAVLQGYVARNTGKPMPVGGDELPNDDNLALITGGGPDLVVVGSGPLRELDLVAVFEPTSEATPAAPINCFPGSCSTDGGRNDLVLSAVGGEVTLFDRRTGAVVEKRSFPPGTAAACPEAQRAGLSSRNPAAMVEVMKWVGDHLKK